MKTQFTIEEVDARARAIANKVYPDGIPEDFDITVLYDLAYMNLVTNAVVSSFRRVGKVGSDGTLD